MLSFRYGLQRGVTISSHDTNSSWPLYIPQQPPVQLSKLGPLPRLEVQNGRSWNVLYEPAKDHKEGLDEALLTVRQCCTHGIRGVTANTR